MRPPTAETLTVTLDRLFVGAVGRLANDGAPSAIGKQPVDDARWLSIDGVAGDAVADRKHHGGANRALTHYPAEHYLVWRTRYPGFEDRFVPGVLGENLSTQGLTEAELCVGDVFTLGEARLQIAQPRQPCWKIGVRVGIAGLAKTVADTGRSGWLYRVLEPGHIRAGDRLTRIERAAHDITLAELWAAVGARRPDATQRELMMTLAEQPALAPEWRKRLARAGRDRQRSTAR